MLPEIILQNRKAWVLPILRENSNLYIENLTLGAGLIAAETMEDMTIPLNTTGLSNERAGIDKDRG